MDSWDRGTEEEQQNQMADEVQQRQTRWVCVKGRRNVCLALEAGCCLDEGSRWRSETVSPLILLKVLVAVIRLQRTRAPLHQCLDGEVFCCQWWSWFCARLLRCVSSSAGTKLKFALLLVSCGSWWSLGEKTAGLKEVLKKPSMLSWKNPLLTEVAVSDTIFHQSSTHSKNKNIPTVSPDQVLPHHVTQSTVEGVDVLECDSVWMM